MGNWLNEKTKSYIKMKEIDYIFKNIDVELALEGKK